jgi:spore maturation protein B
MMQIFNYVSLLIIPLFLLFIILYGAAKKVNVYESFVNGAKEGPGVALNIFPYLIAIFIVIKGFQASGAFSYINQIFYYLFSFLNVPLEVISISIIKPLSGSAATAMFTDIVKTAGPDSLTTKMVAIIVGSAETTFYVLAIYLGAINIKKSRYLVPVCLLADFVGIVVAIIITKLFF